MPVILNIFLSYHLLLILLLNYLSSWIVVTYGFKRWAIGHRRDTVIRTTFIHAAFSFFSQSVGIMLISVIYILMLLGKTAVNWPIELGVTTAGLLISIICYYYISRFLWEKLMIDPIISRKLFRLGLIFASPWYFFLNLI